jgi:type IV secretory pathway TraG/TraD family ATPase VirD4
MSETTRLAGAAAIGVMVMGLAGVGAFLVIDGATRRDWSVARALNNGDLGAPARAIAASWDKPGGKGAIGLSAALGLAAGVAAGMLAVRGAGGRGARFADAGDLASAGFFRSRTLLLGRFGGQALSWDKKIVDPATGMPEWTTRRRLVGGRYLHSPYFGHVFVSGPTRSGKGASLIIPNALEFRGSMVILDIRGETFDHTAGWRSRFSKVFKFAPAQRFSHGYNPLDFIRTDPGFREMDIGNCASGIVASAGLKEEYWMKDAREMVAGVISYVLESKRVERKAISSVMDVLFGRIYVIDRIKTILALENADLSTFTIAKLNAVVNMGEKQFAGVYGEARMSMRAFTNEIVQRATDVSSFDIRQFRKESHTVYLDFRVSQIAVMTGIANVLLSQLINIMSDERPKPGEHKILLMLDEFTTLGKIEPLIAMMKVLAGNGVSVWTFVQSLTDVQAVYGHEGRNSILDNSEAIVFLGGESPDVLDYLEKQLGKRVVKRRSTRTSETLSGPGQSVEERESLEPLMSRDELRMLPRTKALILPRGGSPIMALRNYFFADATLRRLASPRLPAGFVPDLTLGAPPNVFSDQKSEDTASHTEIVEGLSLRLEEWRPGVVGRPPTKMPGATFHAKATVIGKQFSKRLQDMNETKVATSSQPDAGECAERHGGLRKPDDPDSSLGLVERNAGAIELIVDDSYAEAGAQLTSNAPGRSKISSRTLSRSARIRLARRSVEPAQAIGAIVVERCQKIAAGAAEIGFDASKSKELGMLLEGRPG